jgi:sugar phosphate permease
MPWRRVFLVLMLLPLVSAALIGLVVPEPARVPRARGEAGAVGAVFRNRGLWLLGLAGMSPIWTQWLIGTWGPALFAEVGVRQVGQALYASLLGVAALPGLLVMGALSDRLLKRGVGRRAVFAAAILCVSGLVALMGLVVQLRGPAWLLAGLVFLTSFFVWGAWAPVQALVAQLFPQQTMGVAFGLLNATAFVASLLAPPITGLIRDGTGSFAGGCYLAAVVGLLGVPLALAAGPGAHPTAR